MVHVTKVVVRLAEASDDVDDPGRTMVLRVVCACGWESAPVLAPVCAGGAHFQLGSDGALALESYGFVHRKAHEP